MKYINSYYCFLCNDYHKSPHTEEHFIPRSIDGPKKQWLPVCEKRNKESNKIFDNNVKDILYMARFQETGVLKREGEALLNDGNLKEYKFAYKENKPLPVGSLFKYFYDRKLRQIYQVKILLLLAFLLG